MANNVKIAISSKGQPNFYNLPKDFSVYLKEMKTHFQSQFDKVLLDSPDLIVFPECSNKYWWPGQNQRDVYDYYEYAGDTILDYLKEVAKKQQCKYSL